MTTQDTTVIEIVLLHDVGHVTSFFDHMLLGFAYFSFCLSAIFTSKDEE